MAVEIAFEERVGAETPHTFVNAGPGALKLIAIQSSPWFQME